MDYQFRSFFSFYLFINSVFILIQAKKHILLDMKAAGGELGWLTSPNDQGWEIVQTAVNDSLLYTYSVCNVATDTEEDNWLRTTFIQRPVEASGVSVEMHFVVRDCNTFKGMAPACRETFSLYLYETDMDVGTIFWKGQFHKITTVAPDEMTTTSVGGRASLRVNVETQSIGPLSKKGFYLAFQDMGACVALLNVRVFYTTCPPIQRNLATFPEHVTAKALTEVEGSCVKNAVTIGQAPPRMYCTAEGEWVVPVGQCYCRAGYQAVGPTCQACDGGYYKNSDSSQPCEVCPANTQHSGPGALHCPCLDGFFRADTDPSSAPCSSPPSPPEDLKSTPHLTVGSLQLTWRPPSNTGGRTDVVYNVVCEHCNGATCAPCGGRVHFEPTYTSLREPEVTVSELEPHINYTFKVEALNGVSHLSPKKSIASITTDLQFTEPPKVTFLRVVDRTPSSLSLSWAMDQHTTSHHSPHYELMYRIKENDGVQDITTYNVLRLDKNMVQIRDLLPGTKYVFRVETLTPEGHPSSHSAEHEFETLPLAESHTQDSSMIVMGAIAGGGAMLLIVVVILLLHKRRLNSHIRQRSGGHYSCPENPIQLVATVTRRTKITATKKRRAEAAKGSLPLHHQAMDSDCLNLLPSVCEVLADSKLLLHDDTCLEKLLDCFKELMMQNGEQYFMQYLPCLLRFLQSISKSQTVDPSIFSFSLKLAGLLAGKEDNFTLLEERGVLDYMFQPDSWHMMELWKNSLVRYGWLHGLWNMLQHSQSINFFCKNGIIHLVLHLQNDKGFFITSLTSQILAHILNSIMPVVQSNNTKSEALSCSPDTTEFVSVTKEVMNHVSASLASEDQAVIIPALRLLATILTQCREPLKEMFWKHVVGPLEVLANANSDSFTIPIIAVLQAVAQSPVLIQSDCRVETLMDIMLFSRSAPESVQCAAIILQIENCPEVLKWKATDVILLPLLCATASPLQLHEPDKLKGHILQLEKQLSQKVLCVCLLTQSLSSLAEHVYKGSLADIPVQLIACSVIKLLEICIGHCPFTFREAGAFPHLIGCNKVQHCSIYLLGGLTIYADALECTESTDLIEEALMILLQYLQSPDSHATVLKKTYQATLKWLNLCSPSSDLWKMVINELFQLTKKHICDGRWEVRDSTLEFITQLTANLKGNRKYTETLHSSGIISVLFTSLSDLEGYVQASAVAALGEAVTTSDVCSNVQEKAVTHLLSILSQDTQSFPHRAAVKVFIAWLKSPNCCTALEQSITSVLLLGGNDIDWEVKVLTLDLADALMDKLLNHCPCHFLKICRSSESTCIMHVLSKLKELGLFDFLFKCLFDCDRPVSQKACSLLLKLRTFLREITTADHKALTLDICKYSWNEEMVQRYLKNQEVIELHCVKNRDKSSYRQKDKAESLDQAPTDMDLCQILELLDLETMEHTLSLSSDHVINSPQSLMEDILFMTRESEDNVADCY